MLNTKITSNSLNSLNLPSHQQYISDPLEPIVKMPLSHSCIKIAQDNYSATVAWYEKALAPLGYKKAMSFVDGAVVGFGDAENKIDWWLSAAAEGQAPVSSHHAFAANSKGLPNPGF
jgi:hypothetical protein